MDQAKAYVDDHLSKHSKHDTTVYEKVAPAVTHETVTPHKHHRHYTAVDREIHQTHHHTSIQPIHHKEVLPEKHHHDLLPVETQRFKHGKDHEVAARLREEAAKYQDQSVEADTTESHEHVPLYSGEHIHHHVKEIIQPIIHKTTVQPHVVHHVTRVHEHHDNMAKFHETSSLPEMSLDDFKKQGGVLTGRDARVDSFAGEPRSVGGKIPLGSHRSSTESDRRVSTPTDPHLVQTASEPNKLQKPELKQKLSGFGAQTTRKPTVADRLNPKVDADGDGKAGILD